MLAEGIGLKTREPITAKKPDKTTIPAIILYFKSFPSILLLWQVTQLHVKQKAYFIFKQMRLLMEVE
jgi:hypothetical protein